MKRTILIVGIFTLALAGFAFAEETKTEAPMKTEAAAAPAHIMVTPAEIKWGAAPPGLPPGAQAAAIEGDPAVPGPFTIRVKLPDGWAVPPHFHPADEHATVISGTLLMGMGDVLDAKMAKPLPAGGFGMMPKGEHHFAIAKGETIVQIHGIGPWGITYVNPKDDPRNATTGK